MKGQTPFCLGVVLLMAWQFMGDGALAAAEPLTISLVKSAGVNSQGKERYVEPAGRVIEMVQQPLHLLIEVKNNSDSTAEVRGDDETSYSFEFTDEVGAVTTMTRKKPKRAPSSQQPYKHLSAGEAVIIPIGIDKDMWENVPEFVFGKKQVYKVRVIYMKHNNRSVYSEPYTLIVALGSMSK
jgi:hypothetical protein